MYVGMLEKINRKFKGNVDFPFSTYRSDCLSRQRKDEMGQGLDESSHHVTGHALYLFCALL